MLTSLSICACDEFAHLFPKQELVADRAFHFITVKAHIHILEKFSCNALNHIVYYGPLPCLLLAAF